MTAKTKMTKVQLLAKIAELENSLTFTKHETEKYRQQIKSVLDGRESKLSEYQDKVHYLEQAIDGTNDKIESLLSDIIKLNRFIVDVVMQNEGEFLSSIRSDEPVQFSRKYTIETKICDWEIKDEKDL